MVASDITPTSSYKLPLITILSFTYAGFGVTSTVIVLAIRDAFAIVLFVVSMYTSSPANVAVIFILCIFSGV